MPRVDGGSDTYLCKLLPEFTPTVLNDSNTIAKTKKDRKTKERYQVEMFRYFMTFDIESTTITPDEYIAYEKKRQEAREKHKKDPGIPLNVPRPYAFMYHWQAKIDNEVVYGHYWQEVFDFFEMIRDYLKLNERRRLVCYIHNLGFESWWMLPFLKERYKDIEMFATAPKKPLKMFIPALGIEFRCSQRLSNMSLYYATKSEYGVNHIKAKDDLDYKALHLPNQELNDKEFAYTIIDVVGLYEYIERRLINENDDLFSIPLTSTGYVRRLCRKRCMADKDYRKIFLNTRLDADVLMLLYDASRGGNTHSNPAMTNRLLHDLDSFDAVSEYPYVLVTKQFPMSQFQYYGVVGSMKELEYLINTYACLFTAVFKNLRVKKDVPVAYLSYAKQKGVYGNVRFDNGRVLSVGNTKTNEDGAIAFTITDIDYKLIRDMYEWDELAIADFHIAQYGYLPQPIIDTIMELFEEKCQLKLQIEAVEEKIEINSTPELLAEKAYLKYLYGKCKNRLNGVFGMMYTRPVHGEVYLDENLEYHEKELSIGDIKEKLNDYYKSYNSFLNYAWGVWCTAHARAHLQRLILATNYTDPSGDIEKSNVFVYGDTDSSKCIIHNYTIIDALNAEIKAECESRGAFIDLEGKRFYLGVFERETGGKHGKYKLFKTLGAKKYVYEDKEGLHTTIAGVNKEKAPEELKEVDNFAVNFTFYKAGGKTLFYNQGDGSTKTISGEEIPITNNIAIIDSTYNVNLTLDYSMLLYDYEIMEEFEV